jgi:hypothetical protein
MKKIIDLDKKILQLKKLSMTSASVNHAQF